MKIQPFAKGTILYQLILCGEDDYVREVTSPVKVGSDPMSGRDVTRGSTYTGPVTFLFFNRATAHTGEPIFVHNSSNNAVWCKKYPF